MSRPSLGVARTIFYIFIPINIFKQALGAYFCATNLTNWNLEHLLRTLRIGNNQNCNTCGASCTLIHLSFVGPKETLYIQSWLTSPSWTMSNMKKFVKKTKSSYIILGVCIYTMYNLNQRMKKIKPRSCKK